MSSLKDLTNGTILAGLEVHVRLDQMVPGEKAGLQ